MASARQPVTINGIAFDALMDETRSYEAEIPTYPVEKGFEVSDTIILKPMSLSMTVFLTNTPVTWLRRNGVSPSRVQDVIKQLENLYFQKTPVTIVTSERTYSNFGLISFELTKTTENGTSREIPLVFQEIRVTEAGTTTMPDSYGKSGTTGANAGAASTTSKGSTSLTPPVEGSKGSILYGIAGGAGLLGGSGSGGSGIGGLLGGLFG